MPEVNDGDQSDSNDKDEEDNEQEVGYNEEEEEEEGLSTNTLNFCVLIYKCLIRTYVPYVNVYVCVYYNSIINF